MISLLGATPVFVDIYEKTFNINPSGIDKAIKLAIQKGLTPKAIIPVNLFGLPARYRLIKEKADEHRLFILEDGAQGFGGSIGNSKAGTFGHVSTTSFFPAKPLGGYGDGGAIFTNDNDLAEVMRSIRIHGYGNNKYDNVRIGVNGRLDTIQAAILLEKFEIFDEELKLRNEYSNYYIDNIDNNLSKPFIPKNYKSSWAQFSLLAKNTFSREKYMEQLKKHNIPSMIYYSKPLHLQLVYKNLGYKRGDFPISESVSDRVFSIPMHPYLTNEQQDMIIDSLNNE